MTMMKRRHTEKCDLAASLCLWGSVIPKHGSKVKALLQLFNHDSVSSSVIPSSCPSRTTVVLFSRGIWPRSLRRCLETCCWPSRWIWPQMACPHPTSSRRRFSSRSGFTCSHENSCLFCCFFLFSWKLSNVQFDRIIILISFNPLV